MNDEELKRALWWATEQPKPTVFDRYEADTVWPIIQTIAKAYRDLQSRLATANETIIHNGDCATKAYNDGRDEIAALKAERDALVERAANYEMDKHKAESQLAAAKQQGGKDE